jgi:uncharacterized protein
VIAIDTNVLVYAHRQDADLHREAADRVRAVAQSPAPWALLWPCLHEFYSIVTHPRIYDPPTSQEQTAEQISAWLESPSVVLLSEGETHWAALRELLRTGKVIGPLVHDARIAALCLSHGVSELWTADRDFGRFPRLKAVNPLV